MGTGLTSVRQLDRLERAERAVRGFEDQWRKGEPNLEKYWAESACDKTISVLAALVKVDMRCRYERGKRPTVAEYIELYPDLCEHSDRVISLVYEEFCLCEEQGEHPDPDQFCDRYDPWRDSLASQLRYHRDFSQVVGAPSHPPLFPEAGDRFEQFQLSSLLGQGGSARVFLAHDDSMGGREVVLKVSADRGNEPSIMGKLDHMHIVPVLRVAMQPERGLRGLSMPFRPGLPLDVIIKKVNPASSPRGAVAIWNALVPAGLAERKPSAGQSGWQTFPIHGTYEAGVAWIVAMLAEALAYSHQKGIFHRDVKPANVLLTHGNGPQLLDFNLAHEPHSADQARAALRGGTLPYMSPEQLEAYIDPDRWDTVGAPAELYSLGLVLHELLTGEPPEVPNHELPPARAIRELLDRRAEPRVSPRAHNPAVSHALEGIVARCLMYPREDRYPDARALAEDLHRFLERRPLRYALNTSTRERMNNWFRRSWRRLALGAVLSAVLVTLLLPHVSGLIPIENRWSFQDAVQCVDRGETDEIAIQSLDSLVDQYPDSSLGWFYRGLAKQLAGSESSDKQADQCYSMALGLPKAEAELRAWSEHDPHIANQLVDVGEFQFIRQQFAIANRAGQIAVNLNPRLEGAHFLIAREQARVGQHALAYDRFTRIIAAAESRKASADRNSLLSWYENRAMASRSLGDRSRNSTLPAASDISRRHYRAALQDIKQGGQLLTRHDDKRLKNKYVVLEALIRMAQGDLETGPDRRSVAVGLYRQASALIEELPHEVKLATEIVALRQDVAMRLKANAGSE